MLNFFDPKYSKNSNIVKYLNKKIKITVFDLNIF